MPAKTRDEARGSMLAKLGLSALTTTANIEIAAAHDEVVRRQTIDENIVFEGLRLHAPAGLYHPAPGSSSAFFIDNMKAFDASRMSAVLEIGAGVGVIALFMAANWKARVVASDISPLAIETIRANAALNGLAIETIQSDLFEKIAPEKFDFIVFNSPLIDVEPRDSVEQYNLCDPDGRIVGAFARGVGRYLKPEGFALFGACSNTAYEVLDDVALNFRIVALELGASGFWRALVAARL